MTTPRTAREVVEIYNYEVWNNRDFALARELFADEIVRHGVEGHVVLTRDEAVKRIERLWSGYTTIHFTLPLIVAGDDGEHVAIVFQCEQTTVEGAEQPLASIEIFHVVDGRIDAVWNNTLQPGAWW